MSVTTDIQQIEKVELVQDGERHATMGVRFVAKSLREKSEHSAPRNVRSQPLSSFSPEQRQAILVYKANHHHTQQKLSTLNIQVKKNRAIFDPDIGPGGGWRCPDGTMYGGRITDRFGRGCGGGLTRRIGRAIMRAGRRLDDIGEGLDRRRARRRAERAVRRDERARRRVGRVARVSNALERTAQRLVGDYQPVPRGAGRERRRPDVPSPRRDLVPSAGGRRRRRDLTPEPVQRESRTGRRRVVTPAEAPAPEFPGRAPRPEGARRRERVGERPEPRQGIVQRIRDAIERLAQRLVGDYEPERREGGRRRRGEDREPMVARVSNALERAAQRVLREDGGRSREREGDNRRRRRSGDRSAAQRDLADRLERVVREEMGLDAERDPDANDRDRERDDRIRAEAETLAQLIETERSRPDGEDVPEAEAAPDATPEAPAADVTPERDVTPEADVAPEAPVAEEADLDAERQDLNDRLRGMNNRELADFIENDWEPVDDDVDEAERARRAMVEEAIFNEMRQRGFDDGNWGREDMDEFRERGTIRGRRAIPRRERPARRERPDRPRARRRTGRDERLDRQDEAMREEAAQAADVVGSIDFGANTPPDRDYIFNRLELDSRERWPESRRGGPGRNLAIETASLSMVRLGERWNDPDALDREISVRKREIDGSVARRDANPDLSPAEREILEMNIAINREQIRIAEGRLAVLKRRERGDTEPPAVNAVDPVGTPSGPDGRPLGVPDAGAAPRVSDAPKGLNPRKDKLPDSAERDAENFDGFARFNELANNFDGDREMTPVEVGQFLDDFDDLAARRDFAAQRLRLADNGDIDIDDGERERLNEFVQGAERQMAAAVPGININDPNFDAFHRREAVRQHVALNQGFNVFVRQGFGDSEKSFDERVEALQAALILHENGFGLSQAPADANPAQRAFFQALKTHQADLMNQRMADRFGVNVGDMRRIVELDDERRRIRPPEFGRLRQDLSGDSQQRINAEIIADANAAMAAANNIPADLAVLRNLAEADAANMGFAQELANQRLEVVRRQLPGMTPEAFRNLILPDGLQGEVNREALSDIRLGLGDIQAQNERYFADDLRTLSDTRLANLARQIGWAHDEVQARGQISRALNRDADDPIVIRLAARNQLLNSRDGNRQMANRVDAIRDELDRRGIRRPTPFRNLIERDAAQSREKRLRREAQQNIVDRVDGSQDRAKIDAIIAGVRAKRREQLGRVMEEVYGSPEARPWDVWRVENGIPDGAGRQDLSDEQIEDLLSKAYSVSWTNENGVLIEFKARTPSKRRQSWIVEGNVFMTAPGGERRDVGGFERALYFNNGNIKSSRFNVGPFERDKDIDLATGQEFNIDRQTGKRTYVNGDAVPDNVISAKGQGAATNFNNHSWNWMKANGFEKVGVTSAADGPYIWGRVGYRLDDAEQTEYLWRKMNRELIRYDAGASDIILNDSQRNMIEYLSQQAREASFNPRHSPAHMEIILALESSKGKESISERRQQVKAWMMANATLGSGVIHLDDWDISPKGVDVPKVGGYGHQVAPLNPLLGGLLERHSIGELPSAMRPANSNIKSGRAAAQFVRNGGSLRDVPPEFWGDALRLNADENLEGSSKLFHVTRARTGAMSRVWIYRLRGEDGRPTGQGWVVKAGNTNPANPNQYGAGIYDDPVGEVAGWNLGVALGFIPDGAGFDGPVVGHNQVGVVVPYWGNFGEGLGTVDSNNVQVAFRNVPEKAAASRVNAFFHNFFLAVGDRHGENVVAVKDSNGNTFAVASDFGRIANRSYVYGNRGVAHYFKESHWMGYADKDLIKDVAELDKTRRDEIRSEIVQRAEAMRRIVGMGREAFIARHIADAGNAQIVGPEREVLTGADRDRYFQEKVGGIFDVLQIRAERADNDIEEFFNLVDSASRRQR